MKTMYFKSIFLCLYFFSAALPAATITIINTSPPSNGETGTPTENIITKNTGELLRIIVKPKENLKGVISISGQTVATSEVNRVLRYRYTVVDDVTLEIYYEVDDNQGEDYQLFWQQLIKEMEQGLFSSEDFLYELTPDVASCFAGSLSTEAKLRVERVYNKIRELHQLPLVSYDLNSESEAQEASLIQRANNFLSHTPSPSAACYSQTGFDGSSTSNLHLGSHASDPASDLISWVDDASNLSGVAAVGHRRWLLTPFSQLMSYGQVFGASAAKVFGFNDSAIPDADKIPDFIAFPYLRYPYIFFSDKDSDNITPWSISIVENKTSLFANQHDYFSQAQVSVIQKNNGQALNVNNLHTDISGMGVPNLLSWEVSDWQYDTEYTVIIDNIDYQFSETSSLQYDVYIDYKNLVDIVFPLEEGDQINERFIQGRLFDTDDKDSYEVSLEGITTFTGSSQFSNMGFYIAVYEENKQLIATHDMQFNLDLPKGRYTLVISNCNAQGGCYSQPKDYSVQIN